MARTDSSWGKALGLCILLSGCSVTPDRELSDALAQAKAAIHTAETSRAREFAALEFRIAQDFFFAAKAVNDNGDKKRFALATLWAKQALADAKLAEVRSQSEKRRRSTTENQSTWVQQESATLQPKEAGDAADRTN